MTLAETKPFYKSLTLQGSAVTLVALVVNLVFGEGTISEGDITAISAGIAELVGIVMAIYGRIRASSVIA